jgi:hypothetical protein
LQELEVSTSRLCKKRRNVEVGQQTVSKFLADVGLVDNEAFMTAALPRNNIIRNFCTEYVT